MRLCAVERRFKAIARSVLLLAALHNSPGYAEVETPGQSARDLHYGVVLYHYFQQQYFDALTELMAAQSLTRLPHHADEAELLRGGMSLSYGIDEQARAVFENLLDDQRDRVDSNRAWFYLGKLGWRRGEVDASRDALGRITPDYSGMHADEARYLQAIQALQAGDEQRAARRLQQVRDACPFKPYYFYNMGARRAAAERWQDAALAFAQVGQLGCGGSAELALADRAHTAAGFSQLAAGEPEAARAAFTRVRLRGHESDRALLGYGWTYANGQNYAGALGPWQTLANRDLATASARESLLAIPFAYEQLAQPAAALRQYQLAAERYAGDRVLVESVISQLRVGDLQRLFGLEEISDLSWLGGSDPAPDPGHGRYLVQMLSTDGAQLAMREYRDLHENQRRLLEAQQRLEVMRRVDSEQQRVWQATIEEGRAGTLIDRRDSLQANITELRARLQRAVADGDARALATAGQLARWQRLERAETRATALGQTDKLERLRLARGLMAWQDSENLAGRRWQLQREMGELEALAAQSEDSIASLQEVLAGKARPVYEQRIETLASRVQEQQTVVQAALAQAELQLRNAALAALEQQRQQLAQGEAQALLSIARLYDQASPEVPR